MIGKTNILPHNPIIWSAGPHDNTGNDNLGLFTNDATKRFMLGTRALAWDGSVYRYSLAAAGITSTQMACHTTNTGDVAYEVIALAASAGSKELTINQASITENQYAGGYVIVFETGASGAFVRGVMANTASNAASDVTLTLDGPLPFALTTADAYELYPSPYGAMSQANTSGEYAFMGVPQQVVTSAYYFWLKTWGPIFIAPQSTVGGSYIKKGYFRHDGSIDARGQVGTNVSDQEAGYCLIGSAAGNGPLFMLTVNI